MQDAAVGARELFIFGAFVLLCAIGVVTVLLPDGSSDPDAGAAGSAAPTPATRTTSDATAHPPAH